MDLLSVLLIAQVKIAGVEFLPDTVIFPSSDERSRATAEGSLSDGCRWALRTETRVGHTTDSRDCVVYYYRTAVALTKRCGYPRTVVPVPTEGAQPPPPPAPSENVVSSPSSERSTIGGKSCQNAPFTPTVEARILSVGTNADERKQEIVVQPDGTRVTVLTEAAAVTVVVAYPDGSIDTLSAR